ncbi:hypothetical protein HDU93_000410 [Gonapodya sp. JEL0774]|nr:hypothetical protein HDU93_000410 [Gonapodya sp. JEL0774]
MPSPTSLPHPAPYNPLLPFLSSLPHALFLDGGLATELEAMGKDLADTLWSAKVLFEDPNAIKRVHMDYFKAGAQVATTASYQGSVTGFMNRGFSRTEAVELIRLSADLAFSARAAHLTSLPHPPPLLPLIALSSGPYGATLHDGSEYTGAYVPTTTPETLAQFHRERCEVLVGEARRWDGEEEGGGMAGGKGAWFVAVETVPAVAEARAALSVFAPSPASSTSTPPPLSSIPVLLSFSYAPSGATTSYGDTPAAVARAVRDALDDGVNLVAVGVNCSPPGVVRRVLAELRKELDLVGVQVDARGGGVHGAEPAPAPAPRFSISLVAYPNRGEVYDVVHNAWHQAAESTGAGGVEAGSEQGFAKTAVGWWEEGCRVVGGCCRTTPGHIRAVRAALEERAARGYGVQRVGAGAGEGEVSKDKAKGSGGNEVGVTHEVKGNATSGTNGTNGTHGTGGTGGKGVTSPSPAPS